MGLLDSKTHKEYYQSNDLGNYQFTSLDNIISQFEIAYVGENKIIPKIKRADIAFHAMRGLQELSFDTFKSVKSQQIDLPPTLTMLLPHDYVNYTKISWTDSAGIKHLLYPTSATSNPFQVRQEDDGSYSFPEDNEEVIDGDFSNGSFDNWAKNPNITNIASSQITSNSLKFSHRSKTNYNGAATTPAFWGHALAVWQELDVSDKKYVTLSASGTAVDFAAGGPGILRVGLSTTVPDGNTVDFTSTTAGDIPTTNSNISTFDLSTDDGVAGYLEWSVAGDNTALKNLQNINVENINTVYVIVVSFHNFTASNATLTETNSIDDISVINSLATSSLVAKVGNETESSTWNSYKGNTPSENNNDDYEDDTYWPSNGQRYGLDPQHAQANGSFYIDNRLGKIHFSSNISGKTVILDYISDSLGTDAEMQVHKFAEDAMYKYIAHAILSTSSYGQGLVGRFTKEKFAAVRKAKLRLSNIKLEELTQVLRGKSKYIKH